VSASYKPCNDKQKIEEALYGNKMIFCDNTPAWKLYVPANYHKSKKRTTKVVDFSLLGTSEKLISKKKVGKH